MQCQKKDNFRNLIVNMLKISKKNVFKKPLKYYNLFLGQKIWYA